MIRYVKNIIKMLLPYFIYSKRYNLNRNYAYFNLRNFNRMIYNEYGELYKEMYIVDTLTNHSQNNFVAGRIPRYILWNRANNLLKNQFFGHYDIYDVYNVNDDRIKKFAILFESYGIVKEVYDDLYNNKSLANKFDAIFTPNYKLLQKYKDKCFFIPGGGVYIGTEFGGGKISDSYFYNKHKLCSIVSSEKVGTPLHRMRREISLKFSKNYLVDCFGNFNGGEYIKIANSLLDYRYSIIFENNIDEYYFTEKILNCFATMTVPIYIGACQIDKFFNKKGIISVDIRNLKVEECYDLLISIVSNLNEQDYLDRKEYIFDNYQRVQQYLCIEDYIYNNYSYMFN